MYSLSQFSYIRLFNVRSLLLELEPARESQCEELAASEQTMYASMNPTISYEEALEGELEYQKQMNVSSLQSPMASGSLSTDSQLQMARKRTANRHGDTSMCSKEGYSPDYTQEVQQGEMESEGKDLEKNKEKAKGMVLINGRCVINRFKQVMDVLHPHLRKGHHNLLKKTPFHQLLDLPHIVQERTIIDYLLGCYDSGLGCFNIQGHQLYFRVDDVGLLTGLSLKGKIVDVKNIGESTLYNKFKESKGLLSKEVIEGQMKSIVHSSEIKDEIDFVKLFCIYTIGTVLMPQANFGIPRWAFKYGDNLEELSNYAWGLAVYDWIMDALPTAAKRVQRRNEGETLNVGYLRGCTSLLTIWFYELTRLVHPSTGGKTPRILNWTRKTYMQQRIIDNLLMKKKCIKTRMLPSFNEEEKIKEERGKRKEASKEGDVMVMGRKEFERYVSKLATERTNYILRKKGLSIYSGPSHAPSMSEVKKEKEEGGEKEEDGEEKEKKEGKDEVKKDGEEEKQNKKEKLRIRSIEKNVTKRETKKAKNILPPPTLLSYRRKTKPKKQATPNKQPEDAGGLEDLVEEENTAGHGFRKKRRENL